MKVGKIGSFEGERFLEIISLTDKGRRKKHA